MKQRKKILGILFVIVVLLLGLAGYLYYHDFPYNNAKIASNIITTETTAKTDSQVTTEQRQELPDDYVWDTERLGEPPQIVYDFAENRERIESIMKEAEGIISEGNGFSAGYENKETIYYYSGGENIKNKIDKPMRKNIEYILINTKFYELTKSESGYWTIYYSQEEEQEHFIFTMEYHAGMTDEQAYEEGYYRVVGDWFFWKIWKI